MLITFISAAKVVKKLQSRKFLVIFFIFFCIFHYNCVLLQPENKEDMKRILFPALVALMMMSCVNRNERLLTSATGSIY